eukprot:1741375-Lingulodinium_polyedra.AAC.1
MTPQWTSAGGWQLHFLGALFGPVVTDPDVTAFLGAARPTSPRAEVTAALAALKLVHHRAPALSTP